MDQSNQTPKAPENQEQKYGESSAAIRLSHGASLCGLQWKPGRHYSPHKSE